MPQYCLVKHHIVSSVIDGPDVGNEPDTLPISGDVTFYPILGHGDSVVVTDGAEKASYVLAPISARIVNGKISVNGEEGVKLFAGGPDTNPDRIRYQARFTGLNIAGSKSLDLKDILFEAIPGGELALSVAQPVPGAPYPGYSATIEEGISQIEGARDQALLDVDTALDTSPRIPRIETVPGYLGLMVDAAGTPTDLAIRSSDGQFAEWVVKRLAGRIEDYLNSLSQADVADLIAHAPQVPALTSVPGYLGLMVDAAGTPTDLAIRSSDGQFAEWVVKRLAGRIEDYLPPNPGEQSLTTFPVMGARLAVNQEAGLPSNFVFCGSSTTANSLPTGYVDRLVKGLQKRYPSPSGSETALQSNTLAQWTTIHTDPGIHGYGCGVGGTNSGTYLTPQKVNGIQAIEPTAVLHMIGANDFVHSINPSLYKSNIEGWINQLDAGFSKPTQHILVHTFQRWGPWGGAGADPNPDHYLYDWDEYGTALAQIAASRDNVGFIDNTAAFHAAGVDGSGSDPLDLISPDDVHANPAGHRLIADLILESLRNIS